MTNFNNVQKFMREKKKVIKHYDKMITLYADQKNDNMIDYWIEKKYQDIKELAKKYNIY